VNHEDTKARRRPRREEEGNRFLFVALFVCFVSSWFAPHTRAAEPVTFGGLEIEGKRVAFVCDGSRWTKNKLDELKDELTHAVRQMTPDQQFAVLFFADDKTTGFNAGKLAAATDQNKDALRDWLKDVEADGEPTPMPGLTTAFEARPDSVVFITDGVFDNYDEVEAHVAKLNPERKVRVYAVGFFATETADDSRQFMRFMRALADRNNGRSKAVYADELKRTR
jgi:hypothetical protein